MPYGHGPRISDEHGRPFRDGDWRFWQHAQAGRGTNCAVAHFINRADMLADFRTLR